jgi:hypothetical protein
VGLWAKVWAGQGSAAVSAREKGISPTTVPGNPPGDQHTFLLAPGWEAGFAVGMPVWVFNQCFADNPQRQIHLFDIEAEEAAVTPDAEITGLYGVIVALDAAGMATVQFNDPPTVAVDFPAGGKPTMMISPDGAKGFYWEASPGLVDLCGHLLPNPFLSHCVIRWNYRFWNSTQNPCPGTLGAAYVCDGDGESFAYELHGDRPKDILNPVDWIDLWASPILDIVVFQNNGPGQTVIEVCDICPFEPCDIVQIVDCDCTGREGNGPGYVAAVVSTTPLDEEEDCDQLHAVKGSVTITPAIPATIEGCPGFDDFATTRKARIFKKPDVFRDAHSITTTKDADGCPSTCCGDSGNLVHVDFETGKFTFADAEAVRALKICYRTINTHIEIPTDPGIYFLRGQDKSGCQSPPSKPIKVPDPFEAINLFSVSEPTDVPVVAVVPAYAPLMSITPPPGKPFVAGRPVVLHFQGRLRRTAGPITNVNLDFVVTPPGGRVSAPAVGAMTVSDVAGVGVFVHMDFTFIPGVSGPVTVDVVAGEDVPGGGGWILEGTVNPAFLSVEYT